MKKIFYFLCISFLLANMLTLNCFCESADIYSEIYSAIPKTQNENSLLEENGINGSDPEYYKNFTFENVLNTITSLFNDRFKAPFSALLFFFAAILIIASFKEFLRDNHYFAVFCSVAVFSSMLIPLFQLFVECKTSAEYASDFMLSFIPAYFGVMLSAGYIGTVTATSPVLMFAANATALFSSHVLLPLMSGYLGITIASSASKEIGIKKLALGINKFAAIIGGVIATLYSGFLSISGTLAASSDTLALKTTRFFIGGVPIVGGAIGDSLLFAKTATETVKTTYGLFGIISVAAYLLPTIISLLFWKLCLFASSAFAGVLGENDLSDFLQNVSSVLSVTIGILLFIALLFIVGLSVLIMIKGGAA